MNPHLIVYRSVADDYENFSLSIYPAKPQEVVLEYENHFTAQKEKLTGNHVLNDYIYTTLKKLANYLSNEQAFKKHLRELPQETQETFTSLFKTIRFEDEGTYYLLDLLDTMEKAQEAGFFDELQSITAVKNTQAWSSWTVSSSDNTYHLSGVVEKPEYIDFTFKTTDSESGKKITNSWDNPAFLYQNLYPVLQKAYSLREQIAENSQLPSVFWDDLSKARKEVAQRIMQEIPITDWAFVYEMILEAQKVGFWQLYLQRNVAQILENIFQIQAFYQNTTPEYFATNQIITTTQTEILAFEKEIGIELPADYKAFLENNTLSFDFDGNFRVLSILETIKCWQRMGELLDKGIFDDGRIEHHIKENFGNWEGDYIQQVWWSKKWIPFAEDSCGNMKCIDLDPAENGSMYQLISMEIQDGQGPFLLGKYQDFADYLAKHLQYLQQGQFRLTDYHTGKMIEVDSYLKPQ